MRACDCFGGGPEMGSLRGIGEPGMPRGVILAGLRITYHESRQAVGDFEVAATACEVVGPGGDSRPVRIHAVAASHQRLRDQCRDCGNRLFYECYVFMPPLSRERPRNCCADRRFA